jgi:hypothetical protein
MDESFQKKLQAKLDGYRDWSRDHTLLSCRLVQYCGVDLVGVIDVPLADVESQIKGLVCEGFYVDWTEREGRLVLRVWEFGGPEPEWAKVLAEQALADIKM